MTNEVRHISISIDAKPEKIYQFIFNPLNLPKWASGLSKSEMKKTDDGWLADSPMGPVKVKFAEQNNFWVLDHDVTLPSGDVVHNPLRVLKNASGSEVVFTLIRQPGMSDKDYESDAKHIVSDLETLKTIFNTK